MIRQRIDPLVIFILMSVVAHATVLVSWGGRLGVHEAALDNAPVSQILNIELVKQEPQPAKPIEVPPEPEPMPLPEEKIIEEVKPLEAPVEQPVEEPQKTVEQQPEQLMEPQVQGEQLQYDHQLQIKQKEQYLQLLMKHIDAHKFYPAAARRRGIEGEVQISFELTADKSACNIEADGSVSVLERAAIQAVRDASPFPEPPPMYLSPVRLLSAWCMRCSKQLAAKTITSICFFYPF